MKDKEFILTLAERTGYSENKAAQMAAVLADEIACQLEEEKSVMIMGFGTFEVKKKLERIIVNPTNKQRMLVPPRMVVAFRPNAMLKEKTNNPQNRRRDGE